MKVYVLLLVLQSILLGIAGMNAYQRPSFASVVVTATCVLWVTYHAYLVLKAAESAGGRA